MERLTSLPPIRVAYGNRVQTLGNVQVVMDPEADSLGCSRQYLHTYIHTYIRTYNPVGSLDLGMYVCMYVCSPYLFTMYAQ